MINTNYMAKSIKVLRCQFWGCNVDKKMLKEFMDLRFEIERLNKRIKRLKDKCIEHDRVTGSNIEFPYQTLHIEIEGYGMNLDHIRRLEIILKKRKALCEVKLLEIESFISSIPDSRIRMIFEDRYIKGYSWISISRRFGSLDESYARKVHDRFLDKL